MTHALQYMYSGRTDKMVLRNCYVYIYCIERNVNISAFAMLLFAMTYLHMLIFRLMVNMVAEFGSLVVLIHNTLLGEITISSS